MLNELILFRKGDCHSKVCVFKGGILDGAHQFWGNPYLNSRTILFDECIVLTENFAITSIQFLL